MEAKTSGTEIYASSEIFAVQGCLKKQLRKTKFCMYHLQGSCRFGTACSFAHTYEEMQSTPNLRKTKLCKLFLEGKCQDEMCEFAHGQEDRRISDVFFKRKMCAWNQKGKCRHGSQCHFAHHVRELRSDDVTATSDLKSDPQATILNIDAMLKPDNSEKSFPPSRTHRTPGKYGNISRRSNASTTSGTASPVRSEGSGGGSNESLQADMAELQQQFDGLPPQFWHRCLPQDTIGRHASDPARLACSMDGVSFTPNTEIMNYDVQLSGYYTVPSTPHATDYDACRLGYFEWLQEEDE